MWHEDIMTDKEGQSTVCMTGLISKVFMYAIVLIFWHNRPQRIDNVEEIFLYNIYLPDLGLVYCYDASCLHKYANGFLTQEGRAQAQYVSDILHCCQWWLQYSAVLQLHLYDSPGDKLINRAYLLVSMQLWAVKYHHKTNIFGYWPTFKSFHRTYGAHFYNRALFARVFYTKLRA